MVDFDIIFQITSRLQFSNCPACLLLGWAAWGCLLGGAKLMVFYKIMVMMLKKSHLASKILNSMLKANVFFLRKKGLIHKLPHKE